MGSQLLLPSAISMKLSFAFFLAALGLFLSQANAMPNPEPRPQSQT